MANVTYAQLTALALPIQDNDTWAAYRGSGPLQRFTASAVKTYLADDFLPLDGSEAMTGQLQVIEGTEDSPAIVAAGAANTGVYFTTSQQRVGVSISGVSMSWNDSDGFNIGRSINYPSSLDVASAATTPIGDVQSSYARVTGTTTITSFGSADTGVVRYVRFAGALTLTYNATSLILPGSANITTAAGDMLKATSEGSSNWRVEWYTRSSGRQISPAGVFTSLTVSGRAGVGAQVTTPITANSISYTSANMLITGGGTLNTITDGSEGELLFLRGGSGGTTTISTSSSGSAGTIFGTGAPFTLDSAADVLFLIFTGAFWCPVSFQNNG